KNKTLNEWLKQREVWELSTNAIEALKAMGTNVIPALITRLTYREPVFQLSDNNVRIEAVGAFIGLGEFATPALPVLAALMDTNDGDVALHALLATLGTGS